MPDPGPWPALKTPWGSTTRSPGASDGLEGVPPIPIPDHTLIRRIGRGAYGEVWLARNALGQYRAVKIVHRQAFDDDRPFEREFAGIQRFEPVSRSHESQLNILHVGRTPEAFYYVMEVADDMGRGPDIDEASYTPRTLRSELLLRGRLPVEECIRLALALTTALEHLHRHGLIHRDIKPSNIIFVQGIPKLADIGLVAQAERTASFVGTEGYLPPEGPGTVQADLFSLGKVLYEIATGHDRQQFPELPTDVAELPDRAALAEFNEVLVRAGAPDVKQRYQTAAELHADLALLQSGRSVARLRSVERRLRFVQRAGGLVTIAAAVLTGLYLWQARQSREIRRLATLARQSETAARESLYAADMNLAHQALLADNRREARALLQSHVPPPGQPDLRGFEWRYLWQQCQTEELFRLAGPSPNSRVAAFSPDGQRLAVGGEDGTTRVFALDTRQELAALDLGKEIRSIVFSADQPLLAIATAESISLWDARTLTLLRRLPDPGWLSPDGRYLLTCRRAPLPASGIPVTTELLLRDTASGAVVSALEIREPWRNPLMSESGAWVTFAPDGKRIAVICTDAIRLFGIPDGQAAGLIPQPLSAGASTTPFVLFSPDGHTLATQDAAGSGLKLWNIARQREDRVLPAHAGRVNAVRFSPDGTRLVSCGADQTIKLWAVATGELTRSFAGEADDVAFSPDGRRLASVSHYEGFVKVWDANAPSRRESFREPCGPLGFNPDGGLVALAADLKPVVIDPATLQVTNAGARGLTNGQVYVPRLDRIAHRSGSRDERWYDPFLGNLAPDGRTVGLFDRWERTMDLWDLRDGQLLCSVEATKPWLAFAPQRRLFTTDTTNATTTVWQLPSGTPLWVFTNRTGLFQALAFSPDESLLVTDEGTRLRLWRIEGAEVRPIVTFHPKKNAVIGLAFSPDGRLLATGEPSGPIRLWAMPAAEPVGVLRGHTDSVIALAFSPEGRTLASMCDDRTVRWWHVATRRELLRFRAPKEDHYYFSLTFSPDGRALAARRVDDEGALTRVWYAPSFDEIARQEGENRDRKETLLESR